MAGGYCAIDECTKARAGRSRHCSMHGARIRRHGDPNVRKKAGGKARSLECLFEKYVPDRPANACWIWQGPRDAKGYGRAVRPGKTYGAHRLFFEFTVGPIPDGLDLLHSCDNPPCVNPAHLSPGTNAQNVADCVSKKRHIFGEQKWSAKLTEAQVMEARQKYATGKYSQAALAREYGLTDRPMAQLLRGETWKHLPLVEASGAR